MHVLIQRYRVRLGTVVEAARYAEKWFVPLAREIPGFRGYYLMAAGNNDLACIGMFETPEGSDAAARLAQEWFAKEWGSFRPLPPEVITGEVLVTGRRGLTERRQESTEVVRANGHRDFERRVGGDRRRGFDRRADFEPLFEQQAAG